MNSTTRTIMIMAGGTGGHIFPGLAVAKELKRRGWDVFWLGAKGGMENKIVPERGIELHSINISGVRGNGLKRKLMLPWVLSRALIQSHRLIKAKQPCLALGFGGYVAFPGGVISRLLGKALVIHEQNSVLGLTNRLLSKIATRTLCAFPGVFAFAGENIVGNPVREDIYALPEPAKRFAGRSGVLRVLVIGGSLGATVFNKVVPQALARLPENICPQVTHQAGTRQIDNLRENYAKAGIKAKCVDFITDMAAAYAEADVVVCRSGALTVAELAASGVGSLLVPLPNAVDDHQTGNAHFLSDAGAAILMPQNDLSSQSLADWLEQLTRERCLEMAEKARTLAVTDAAKRVADICEHIIKLRSEQ